MKDPLSFQDEIAQLLTFYIRSGFEAAGKTWTNDNDAEMENLARLISSEAQWKALQFVEAHESREHSDGATACDERPDYSEPQQPQGDERLDELIEGLERAFHLLDEVQERKRALKEQEAQ
jgi:hypothetical protein